MDWEEEGLLEGLDDEAREARRRLLDELHAEGVGLDELREAVEEDRLVLLPIERALMGPVTLSAREVAEAAGLPLDVLARWQRVVGISPGEDPDEKLFTEDDLEAVKRTRRYVEAGLPLEEIVPVLRTLSGSVARAAEAIRQIFARAYLKAGDTEYDLAKRYGEMARTLMPEVNADLDYLVRLHLREFTRHDAVGMTERLTGELPQAVDVAVGFADFVGFTALGEEVLVDVADRLLELADEHVRKPARVVKSIGDAVMVVSPDPAALVDAMLDLVDAASGDPDLPALRAGVTWGQAVPRAGDWYGSTVNLAARLCQRARPGAVLTTNELRDHLDGRYDFSEAGMKRLKGISEPVPTQRVRRESDASKPSQSPPAASSSSTRTPRNGARTR
jgi:adenylate cyclase